MRQFLVGLLCLGSVTSFAQNGFYLQPESGLGFTDAQLKTKFDNGKWTYGTDKPKGFSTYSGRNGIGYQFNNWQFSTGIDFMRTGYSLNYDRYYYWDLYIGNNEPTLLHIKDTKVDYTIALPLKVGYQINCCKQFFVTPIAGIGIGYNYSERYRNDENDGLNVYTRNHLLQGPDLGKYDNLLSLWGNAAVRLGYKVNSRLSVIAGPEVQYMLTSITNGDYPSQKNYCYSFNAGITWKLTKKQLAKAKE